MDTINTIFFIFSIIVIIFPAITICSSGLVYIKTKKVIFKYLAFLLGMYIIDLAFLHYNDFYHSSTTVLPDTFISFAPFKIILFSAMLITEAMIILTIFNKKPKVKHFIFVGIFIIMEIAFKMYPENNLMIWLFYTTRQFFTIGLCFFFYYEYIKCKNQKIKEYAKKFVGLFALFILMNFIIGIEDALVSSQQQAFSSSGLVFKERNFTENIYWMVVTFLVFINSINYINILEVPSKETEKQIDSDIFAKDIQLTKREKEIFFLIIQHYGNTEIADKLCISSGTLKAHIHNIYMKADVSHRNELIKKFTSSYPTQETESINH
ncbi:MAG: response regulator transcription factor [Coprobacillaceae bacterium]